MEKFIEQMSKYTGESIEEITKSAELWGRAYRNLDIDMNEATKEIHFTAEKIKAIWCKLAEEALKSMENVNYVNDNKIILGGGDIRRINLNG